MERKGKEPWMEVVGRGDPLMMGGGFSIWPPRSYFCSFCKREFKSAQALGGHMNVHRRDRARLRQQQPQPQPQPQRLTLPLLDPEMLPINVSAGPAPAAKEMIPINVSPPVHFSTAAEELRKAVDMTVKELLVAEEGESGRAMLQKGREVVRLELEIGIFGGDAVGEKEEEEDLDLELRLGFV